MSDGLIMFSIRTKLVLRVHHGKSTVESIPVLVNGNTHIAITIVASGNSFKPPAGSRSGTKPDIHLQQVSGALGQLMMKMSTCHNLQSFTYVSDIELN